MSFDCNITFPPPHTHTRTHDAFTHHVCWGKARGGPLHVAVSSLDVVGCRNRLHKTGVVLTMANQAKV